MFNIVLLTSVAQWYLYQIVCFDCGCVRFPSRCFTFDNFKYRLFLSPLPISHNGLSRGCESRAPSGIIITWRINCTKYVRDWGSGSGGGIENAKIGVEQQKVNHTKNEPRVEHKGGAPLDDQHELRVKALQSAVATPLLRNRKVIFAVHFYELPNTVIPLSTSVMRAQRAQFARMHFSHCTCLGCARDFTTI